jgi:hypothetical protein
MIKPRKKRAEERAERKSVRCAIYTRKSTEEGLDQDFNSLRGPALTALVEDIGAGQLRLGERSR